MPNLVGGVLVGFAWQFIFVMYLTVLESFLELTGFVIGFLLSLQVLGFGYSCCMADERIYDADLHCTDTEYSGKSVGVCEN